MARRTWAVVGVLAVLALAVAGLALRSSASRSELCAAPVEDPLDRRSLQHALGGPPPSYSTEPPTSGPHQPGRHPGGVAPEPLPGPVQVGALEAGQVLLQHRDLEEAERGRLEALAGPLVIVAPNPALPSRVVASAWRTRQPCRGVDDEVLRRFLDDHAGRSTRHGG